MAIFQRQIRPTNPLERSVLPYQQNPLLKVFLGQEQGQEVPRRALISRPTSPIDAMFRQVLEPQRLSSLGASGAERLGRVLSGRGFPEVGSALSNIGAALGNVADGIGAVKAFTELTGSPTKGAGLGTAFTNPAIKALITELQKVAQPALASAFGGATTTPTTGALAGSTSAAGAGGASGGSLLGALGGAAGLVAGTAYGISEIEKTEKEREVKIRDAYDNRDDFVDTIWRDKLRALPEADVLRLTKNPVELARNAQISGENRQLTGTMETYFNDLIGRLEAIKIGGGR